MKTLSLIIVFFVSSIAFSQESTDNNITVTVDNVLNNNGKVIFALHTEETFMKGPGIQNSECKIENGKVKVVFKNVAPGTYAIMALHDENENNRMDYIANGMPKENYGTSNNPMAYGPPQFIESKFEFTGEALSINIRF